MLSRRGPNIGGHGGSAAASDDKGRGKRWDGTVAADRGNKPLPVDVVRLLKTQDVGYIRTVSNSLRKEAEQLRQRWILLGGRPGEERAGGGRRQQHADDDDDHSQGLSRRMRAKLARETKASTSIVFFDDEDERAAEAERLRSEQENIDGEARRVDDREEWDGFDDDNDQTAESSDKDAERDRVRRQLARVEIKLRTLREAEHELEVQRARMAKTSTVGGVTKKGKTFKIRERKR